MMVENALPFGLHVRDVLPFKMCLIQTDLLLFRTFFTFLRLLFFFLALSCKPPDLFTILTLRAEHFISFYIESLIQPSDIATPISSWSFNKIRICFYYEGIRIFSHQIKGILG